MDLRAPITELSLFSGGGGGLLATQHFLNFQTVCYVEKAKHAQRELLARIRDGLLDDAPIWDDVRTFDGRPWRGIVDIITAGFPCQGYSFAGLKLGPEDARNEWPSTIRIIREVKPQFILLENVTALLTYTYYGTILSDLAEAGYDARWEVVSAADVGAPHLRERLWVMAHTSGGRRKYTHDVRGLQKDRFSRKFTGCTWWKTEPQVGRVADGLARGMGRALELLGEGQVPHSLAEAWLRMVYEEEGSVE